MPRKPTSKARSARKRPGPKRKPANTPPLAAFPFRKLGGDGGLFADDEDPEIEPDLETLAPEDETLVDSMQLSQQQMREAQLPSKDIDPTRIPSLYEFLEDTIDIYLDQVWLGVFPHIAAAMSGIPREVFDNWMAIGKRDYVSEDPAQKTSLNAKLYGLTFRKLAARRGLAESTVATQSQLEYLRRGAARTLGDEWVDIREMVVADKAGLISKEQNTVIGNQTVIVAHNFEQLKGIFEEYNLGKPCIEQQTAKVIDVHPVSDKVENLVKNREEVSQLERPPPMQPVSVPSSGISNADLRNLRGGH